MRTFLVIGIQKDNNTAALRVSSVVAAIIGNPNTEINAFIRDLMGDD